MKTVYLSLVLIFSIFNCYSNEYECVENLLEKKIIFGFNDGDVHQVSFRKNDFEIVIANYSEYGGRVIYSNMMVYCFSHSEHVMLFKTKNNRGVSYRFPVHVEFLFM